jgi:hypothetical protein
MPLSFKDLSRPMLEPVTLGQAKKQCVVADTFTDDDEFLSGLIVAARQHVERNITFRPIFPRRMRRTLDFFPYPNYDGTINPNDRHVLYGEYWHQLAIRLPRPPALSVETIKYIDLAGEWQTLDPSLWRVDLESEPARIVPKPGAYWPYTQSWLPGSVSIEYTAGAYTDLVSELVAVPNDPPYSLALTQLENYLGMQSLTAGDGSAVSFVFSGGKVIADQALAGQMVTAKYYVPECPRNVQQAILLLVSYWYNHRDAAEAQPPKEIEQGVRDLLAGEIFDTFGFD